MRDRERERQRVTERKKERQRERERDREREIIAGNYYKKSILLHISEKLIEILRI